jgi:hypothetical protein
MVGDWWMEGGMGVIDVGETAVVRVGEAPVDVRRVVTPHSSDVVRCVLVVSWPVFG